MKRAFTLLLALCLTIALFACASPTEPKKHEEKSPTTTGQSVTNTEASTVQTNIPLANPTPENPLTWEQALDVALHEAGVNKSDAFDMVTRRDREKEGIVWEVEFRTKKCEYSYEIQAETGEILEFEKEEY